MALVKLGDVAREYKATIKNAAGLPVVGLEHLTPRELILESWDSDVETTFTKGFKKGHILFGRRRAYLKKSAIAPFDGICSGDITVIEAIPEKINPDLLPFVIQNDALFDFAIGKSAGSLSPRVKWEQLRDYTFELPEMDKQQALVDILTAALQTKKAYQRQLAATDELVKSQFIEMFKGCPRCRLGDFIQQVRGVSYKPADLGSTADDEHITLLRANNINNGRINFDDVQYVNRGKVASAQVIQSKDILVCASSGSLEHVGKAALFNDSGEYTFGAFCKLLRPTGVLMPEFIAAYMAGDEYRHVISDLAQGSNINNLRNEHIDELKIPLPTYERQLEFISFQQQSDKSKFELEQAIQRIDNLIKSLIQQNND